MGIKPKFNIDMMLDAGLKYNKEMLLAGLRRVGLQAINKAKQEGSYTDRTGNLRNSVGFLIADEGEIVDSMFGNDVAREYAISILNEFSTSDVILMVFAGMNYASYVQAKGYNVLASAELEAEKAINELFNML